MKIYHNPRCSKSRQTLNLIKEKGVEVEIIEYLKVIPSEKELSSIIKLLGIKPEKLLRKGEVDYKENFKGGYKDGFANEIHNIRIYSQNKDFGNKVYSNNNKGCGKKILREQN